MSKFNLQLKNLTMSLMIRVLLGAFLFLYSDGLLANSYDEIWKLLLKNKREAALLQLNKINNSNEDLEGLLLKQLINAQLGQFEFNNDIIEKGIKKCSISEPLDFAQGINGFLQLMGITMRISDHNRPRINKINSQLDKEQKKQGKYYGHLN